MKVVERIGVGADARKSVVEIEYVGDVIVGTASREYCAITGMGLLNDIAKGVYASIREDRPPPPRDAPAAEMLENGGMS
jgi:hypothetical protein